MYDNILNKYGKPIILVVEIEYVLIVIIPSINVLICLVAAMQLRNNILLLFL